MTNIEHFEPYNLLGRNTGPDNPNVAVVALRNAVYEYVFSDHMGEHLSAYLFHDLKPWLDEYHDNLADSVKQSLIENLYDHIHEFEDAAGGAIIRVAREFEQEISSSFEKINSGGSANTGQEV